MAINLPPPPTWAPLIIKAGSGSGGLEKDETFNPVWLDYFIRLSQALIAGAGAVTFIDLAAPTQFTTSGGPVTTSGTITLGWQSQIQNLFLAGPASGSAAAPTFRAISALDLPAGARPGYSLAPSNISVGASPYVYQNSSAIFNVDVIVSGGTVTAIDFSRDNITYYATDQIAGMFRLSPGDYLKITHGGAPTATLVTR